MRGDVIIHDDVIQYAFSKVFCNSFNMVGDFVMVGLAGLGNNITDINFCALLLRMAFLIPVTRIGLL